MNGPLFVFLDLAAGAALLVWAVRLVRTGFERAFGGQLRLWLRRSTSGHARAAACGTFAALLMQSSTAVAVLMAGFVSSGALAAPSGLAILLGADLGTAIVTQLLASPISVLAPLLLVAGVLVFLRSSRRQPRQVGRILIGLGLIFVSLDLIRAASLPLVSNPTVAVVMAYFADEMLLAFVVAALFTWLVHSSVAAVLLFVAMASQGVMPANAAFAMVLGANLGSGLIAAVLTMDAEADARRAVLANLVLRGGGAAVALIVLTQSADLSAYLGTSPGQQVLNLHLAFNVLVLLIGLPLVGVIYRAMGPLVRDRADHLAGGPPSALDPDALAEPQRAFACAVRELVQAAGLIESMYRRSIRLFEQHDEELARAIRTDAGRVAQIALDLRLYLASIQTGENRSRVFSLAGLASDLEAASDILARKLVGHAETMARQNLRFSKDGWRDITDFHDAVLRNIQSAVTVLMTEDPALARELVEQKETIRETARRLEQRHLDRLKEGLAESIETSGVHIDTLRALKEVNTNFAKIAHPTLRETGVLLDSRLAAG